MKWRNVFALLLSCAFSVRSAADEVRQIDGVRYEQVISTWYQVDANEELWEVRRGRLGVRFDASLPEDSVATVLGALGVTLREAEIDLAGFYRFSFSDSLEPPDVLANVLATPHVETAYLDTYLKFFGTANDRYYANEWNLLRARVDRAWDITAGSASVTIAVIDEGFDIDHEDFQGVIWINPEEDINHNGTFDNFPASAGGDIDTTDNDIPKNGKVDDVIGWDFTNEDNNPRSTANEGHGSLVAGIACAVRNNNKGIAGVAGGNGTGGSRLMPLKLVSKDDASGAIEYAWRQGADVICMSWGGNDPNGAVSTAIENAHSNGTVLFAATGNWGHTGLNWDAFPSTHPAVMAVGSSDENDSWVTWSNYGAHLDLVAPSTGRWTADPEPYIWSVDDSVSAPGRNHNSADAFYRVPANNTKYFGRFSGTSAACPFVAGVAALLKSHIPGLTNEQVRQRLLNSAIDVDSVGFDWKTGWGRVDAYRALTEWGTITGNVTWSPDDAADSTRYVSGDLTIAPGATLTIMPGTIVRIANEDDLKAGADTTRVEINVQGTIVADGTVANPIVFESWHPLTTSDWVGIQLDSTGSGGTFDNCFISRAEVGVDSRAPLTMTHTVIDRCSYACVSSREGGASIHDCQFTHPGDFGIEVQADSVDVRDTTVDGAVNSAISAATGAKLMVVDCTATNSSVAIESYAPVGLISTVIDSCSYAGVLSHEGGASIRGCQITHPGDFGIEVEADSVYVRDTTVDGALTGAISAQADAKLVVRSCTVTNSYVAVDSYAPLTLISTVIDSCSYAGVLSRSGGAWIQGCELRAPGPIGIDVVDDAAIVRNTTVDGAVGKALSAQAGALLEVRGSLFKNSDTGLDINGAATVDVDSTCFFYANDIGIHLYQAGALTTIRSSGITWNTSSAILCDASSDPHIVSNIFAHNGSGIYCKNSSAPTIEWNQIQSAGNAITAESYAKPDVGHTSHSGSESSGNNKIAHAAKYVANYTATEIFAQHNCWNINFGTCTPAASKFIAPVDFSDPQCCNFPVFTHGEGEPAPVEGFMFQAEPAPTAPKERVKTALVAIVPNPFNPTTTIQYSLASQGKVEINVYDVVGRLVQELAHGTQVAGKHAVVWEGKDRKGSPVASGIYFVRMAAAGQLFTRKMVLLK